MLKVKVLANDGLPQKEVEQLISLGFEVFTQKVAQTDLASYINQNNIDAVLVRSATKITSQIIDDCPNLKFIARGGVGMDNIAVEYAKSKGVFVSNTPGASTNSVAELTIAHLLSMSKFLFSANRTMPVLGFEQYNILKEKYSNGFEVQGKIIGIIGFGRIGKSVAQKAISLGMEVIVYGPNLNLGTLTIPISIQNQIIQAKVRSVSMSELLKQSDVVSLHTPFLNTPIIGAPQFKLMKQNAILINASRGGLVDENALISALNSGKISRAALDVFEKEPTPNPLLLQHDKISLSPHLGASTPEAQARIGAELISLLVEWRSSI